MATETKYPHSFKNDIGKAVHNFETDQFAVALFKASAALTESNANVYGSGALAAANEVVGTNYPAGGGDLVRQSDGLAGSDLVLATDANLGVASWDWANKVFENVTIPTSGLEADNAKYAVVYNKTRGNKVVLYSIFDAPGRAATAADFTVTLPESGVGVVRFG